MKNVWLGVSVEDQKTADERIPLLMKVPAAVRFLSCEPLLGKIHLNFYRYAMFSEDPYESIVLLDPGKKIHWVIAGGESGPGARPMHPDWARSLRDQCKAADVPFFFKQWGEWAPANNHPDNKSYLAKGAHRDGTIGSAFTADGCKEVLAKVGKKTAGNLLDGKQYLQYPTLRITI